MLSVYRRPFPTSKAASAGGMSFLFGPAERVSILRRAIEMRRDAGEARVNKLPGACGIQCALCRARLVGNAPAKSARA